MASLRFDGSCRSHVGSSPVLRNRMSEPRAGSQSQSDFSGDTQVTPEKTMFRHPWQDVWWLVNEKGARTYMGRVPAPNEGYLVCQPDGSIRVVRGPPRIHALRFWRSTGLTT